MRKGATEKEAREKVAMVQAEGLMGQWEAVKAHEKAEEESRDAKDAARKEYAEMLAKALGIEVGMRVRLNKNIRGRRVVALDYQVARVAFYGPDTVMVYGKQFRKDGTLGDQTHEVGRWHKDMRVEEDME